MKHLRVFRLRARRASSSCLVKIPGYHTMTGIRFRIQDLLMVTTCMAIYICLAISLLKRYPSATFFTFATIIGIYSLVALLRYIQIKRDTDHKIYQIEKKCEKSLRDG